MPRVRYFWDFFGPRAEGTARHFQRHLQQFLAQHGLEGCEIRVTSAGEGHWAVECTAPPAARSAIEGALRPKRVLELEQDDSGSTV